MSDTHEMSDTPLSDEFESEHPYVVGQSQRARAFYRKLERDLASVTEERDLFMQCGIVEIAARNPRVMESMKHWEGRAEKAEAELAAVKAERDALKQDAERNAALTIKLQQALFFWMPSIAGLEHPAGDRAAEDSYLLIGFGIKHEPSAEQLGWIHVDDAIDSLSNRGMRVRRSMEGTK